MDPNRLKQLDEFLEKNAIIPRDKWGARDSKLEDKPKNLDWDYTTVVIHHSGLSGETSPKKIQDKHMDRKRNNWDDVGYHFMIGPDGKIYEGRRLVFKGSHTDRANTGKIGILVMGNFEKKFLGLVGTSPTTAQLEAVKRLVRALRTLFPDLKTLGGHKDFTKTTECPGNELYSQLDALRKDLGMAAP